MFCSNCGMEVEDGSAFCGDCGEPLLDEGGQSDGVSTSSTHMMPPPPQGNPSSIPAPPKAQVKKSSKAPLIIIIILALVGVGIAIAFAFGMGDHEETSTEVKEHQIVFETFGGSRYKSVSFETGTTIDTPDNPKLAGSTFEGWYLDSDFSNPVSFPYTISEKDPETIIFYAKWKKNASVGVSASSSDADYITDPTTILPYSSTTYLSTVDINSLTDEEIQRAINEIYARNGYIFQQSAAEKQFFESRPWYRGIETNQEIVKSHFNSYELANIKLLQSYRDSHS